MANQIVKQPNGLYAIWSSVVDGFTSVDNIPEEIVEGWVADERKKIAATVSRVVAQLESGDKPYFQFTMTFDECLDRMREIHGNESVSEVLELMDDHPTTKGR